jgi:hypothetical protein
MNWEKLFDRGLGQFPEKSSSAAPGLPGKNRKPPAASRQILP